MPLLQCNWNTINHMLKVYDLIKFDMWIHPWKLDFGEVHEYGHPPSTQSILVPFFFIQPLPSAHSYFWVSWWNVKCPHRLMGVHTWSLTDGAIWRGSETFREWSVTRGSEPWMGKTLGIEACYTTHALYFLVGRAFWNRACPLSSLCDGLRSSEAPAKINVSSKFLMSNTMRQGQVYVITDGLFVISF